MNGTRLPSGRRLPEERPLTRPKPHADGRSFSWAHAESAPQLLLRRRAALDDQGGNTKSSDGTLHEASTASHMVCAI
ncbi:hypothetical protein CBOM_07487 [Ceraceosorus bombacis]|uniref:Uncharacterized protein n=1 Tax=Ceraceosorus bombacis TaxID=401625 RepID=A0A0P1BCW4_9BASI|nr:hypothetical protein CBOM_07487 [Ceraceosorus bombacis]